MRGLRVYFRSLVGQSAENQAIDPPAYRIGQDKTVFSYKLITKAQLKKNPQTPDLNELFESLITSDGASLKSLNEEDLEFVLGDNTDEMGFSKKPGFSSLTSCNRNSTSSDALEQVDALQFWSTGVFTCYACRKSVKGDKFTSRVGSLCLAWNRN